MVVSPDRIIGPPATEEEARQLYPPGAVCIVHRGEVDDTIAELIATVNVPEGTHVILQRGSQVAMQRNLCVRKAVARLGTRLGWVLFIDSDQRVDNPEFVRQLLDWNEPVVSGLVLERGYPFQTAAFESVAPIRRLPLRGLEPEGLAKVEACGMGCCLIRRAALDIVGDPWFRVGQFTPDALSEDLDFTYRVHQRGLGVYVDVGLAVGHHMRVTLWPGKRDRRPWITCDGEQEIWVPLQPRPEDGRL